MPATDTNKASVPLYADGERQRRWDLAYDFMSREGLDALIIYGEHEAELHSGL